MQYDFLIVGSGIYGSVCARELTDRGFKCLVIESRPHIGGNVADQNLEGINVHLYGAHIFHTEDEGIWNYVNRFARFREYVHFVQAYSAGEMYSLPFNMHTFSKMWDQCAYPDDERIPADRFVPPGTMDAETYGRLKFGHELFEKFIQPYTEKQWKRSCKDLPASIVRRIPIRRNWDNRYFTDRFQGIPENGYTAFIGNLLAGIEVRISVDYFKLSEAQEIARETIFTGGIDKFFSCRLGALQYRSLVFDLVREERKQFQGCSVVNFPSEDFPYTRTIEHKFFTPWNKKAMDLPYTYLTFERPSDSGDPYYPINDERNNKLFSEYQRLALELRPDVHFGGRLGEYRYYDMHQAIGSALKFSKSVI